MTMLDDLADLFSDEILVFAPSAPDGVGGAGWVVSGTARQGHVGAGGEQRTSGVSGQLYVTKGKINFAGAYGIQPGWKLTLPADFDPQVVIVEEAAKPRDEDGAHHDKVFF